MKGVRILIARTDRLGDVLLSLPTLDYIRKALPDVVIDFLVQDIYVPVLAPFLEKTDVSPVPLSAAVSWKDYTHFLGLYCDRNLAWNAFTHRIPVRAGAYSKAWSFLLFNKGLRQRRSEAEKSEAEYNLDLAQVLVKSVLGRAPIYSKPAIEIPKDEATAFEAQQHLQDLSVDLNQGFVLFHPGMRGSALNLTPLQYLDLINQVEERWKLPVVLSIGPVLRDKEIAETILKEKPLLKVVRNLEIPVLREVFRMAKLVVAPSTGPLHLAHYVGTRTIGLYPPVKTQSPARWAPWGGSGLSTIYSPQVVCLGKKDCVGNTCASYRCMDLIPARFVFDGTIPTPL